MKPLLIATSNRGKFREFSEMLSGQMKEFFSLADFPQITLPPESGKTFEENAILKARAASMQAGIPAIADDSGLAVDHLGGRPGIHSARFAGESATDLENIEKLLRELADVKQEERGGRFVCCIAFCQPDGHCVTFSGQLPGTIIEQPKGSKGFGYDPVFMVSGYDKTLAELDMAIKNRISHRAEAFRKFTEYLATGHL